MVIESTYQLQAEFILLGSITSLSLKSSHLSWYSET